jgi:hypothetical protein
MYKHITVNDLAIRIEAINQLLNTNYDLEVYHHTSHPYRLINERMQVIHAGTKQELYRYLIGVLEGINSYKQAHNV